MDIGSIGGGKDFAEAIRTSILECDVVLAVIGRIWAGIDSTGKRRIDSEGDFVRREISTALKNNKPLIPVLVDGALPPRPEETPDEIAPLAGRNAMELTQTRWKFDIERLVEAILGSDEIRQLVSSIHSATRSQALERIKRISNKVGNADAALRNRTFALMKSLFCRAGTTANANTAPQDRDVRKSLWRCMRA